MGNGFCPSLGKHSIRHAASIYGSDFPSLSPFNDASLLRIEHIILMLLKYLPSCLIVYCAFSKHAIWVMSLLLNFCSFTLLACVCLCKCKNPHSEHQIYPCQKCYERASIKSDFFNKTVFPKICQKINLIFF